VAARVTAERLIVSLHVVTQCEESKSSLVVWRW